MTGTSLRISELTFSLIQRTHEKVQFSEKNWDPCLQIHIDRSSGPRSHKPQRKKDFRMWKSCLGLFTWFVRLLYWLTQAFTDGLFYLPGGLPIIFSVHRQKSVHLKMVILVYRPIPSMRPMVGVRIFVSCPHGRVDRPWRSGFTVILKVFK